MYLGNLCYVKVSCRLDTCIRQNPQSSQKPSDSRTRPPQTETACVSHARGACNPKPIQGRLKTCFTCFQTTFILGSGVGRVG